MKKRFQILNWILIAVNLAVMTLYWVKGGLLLKGITSLCFTLLGLLNLLYAWAAGVRPLTFPVLLTMGLALSTAADVILNMQFISGAVCFALAHVIYFSAYCVRHPFRWKDMGLIAVVAAVGLAVVNLPVFFIADTGMRLMIMAYSVVISFMLGKSIQNAFTYRAMAEGLLAAGSTLFWVSDLMLALELFSAGGRLAHTLCLFTYFPGQVILAHALYHDTNSRIRE